MKNKKLIIICAVAIIILITLVAIVISKQNNKNTELNVKTQEEIEEDEYYKKETFNIKSTAGNRIIMEDLEATNIEVNNNSGQLKINTTLKNKSYDTIYGFFIEIALLDENGNTVTTVVESTYDQIKAKDTYLLTTYATGVENVSTIKGAKIVSLEKDIEKHARESED